ncbi:hypothetical protein FRB99_003097 [Tulasnella sp. 403]|nr:hypothetical protein FRB99_003097 [Tulasnella sp. 403]
MGGRRRARVAATPPRMSLYSGWYQTQHPTWDNSPASPMPPFFSRSTNAPHVAPRLPQPSAVTINMANLTSQDPSKAKVETLFGPPVGVGGVPTPNWTSMASRNDPGRAEEEELTPDVVQEWVRRSKQEADKPVPTTTLQALVNLKRPTIRLTPLSSVSEDQPPSHSTAAAAHGLEFDFDCDAARCAISVRAVLPGEKVDTTVVFERVVDGGFGRSLKFDEHGAILELAKLDLLQPTLHGSQEIISHQGNDQPSSVNGPRAHPDTTGAATRKRFSAFHFRRRSIARDAVGPALQVVDADAETHAARQSLDGDHDHDDDHIPPAAVNSSRNPNMHIQDGKEDCGVKVIIRIEALDELDNPLKSRNAQLTYLHILRMATSAPEGDNTESAVKPWVVKVVKREAVIGAHTFRLQEIYGLATSNSAGDAPADPVEPPSATYPPTGTTPNVSYDTPATEECAVNMVEFGAGGALTHEVEPTGMTNATETTNGDGVTPIDGSAAEQGNGVPNVTAPSTDRPRRKRKAKGWFCPVCRQPYTALLRITTTPPGKRLSEDSFNAPVPVPLAPTQIAAPLTDSTNVNFEPPASDAGTSGVVGGETVAGGKLGGLLSELSLKAKKPGQSASDASLRLHMNTVFGDSYTQTQFDIHGSLNDVWDIIDRHTLPEATPLWFLRQLDRLDNNEPLVYTYNYVYGGGTIDASLVASYTPTVLSMTDQMNEFLTTVASHPTSVPWTSTNTIFSLFIGINDIVTSNSLAAFKATQTVVQTWVYDAKFKASSNNLPPMVFDVTSYGSASNVAWCSNYHISPGVHDIFAREIGSTLLVGSEL